MTALGIISMNHSEARRYELREQALNLRPLDTDVELEKRAKEVIRTIKGDAFLQAWIKDNMGLPSRMYRKAIIKQAIKATIEKSTEAAK